MCNTPKSARQIGAVSSSSALTTAVLSVGSLIDVVPMPEPIRRIILPSTIVAFSSVCQFTCHCVFTAAVTLKFAGKYSDFFPLWDRRSVTVAFVTLRPIGSFKPGTATALLALKLAELFLRHSIQ